MQSFDPQGTLMYTTPWHSASHVTSRQIQSCDVIVSDALRLENSSLTSPLPFADNSAVADTMGVTCNQPSLQHREREKEAETTLHRTA